MGRAILYAKVTAAVAMSCQPTCQLVGLRDVEFPAIWVVFRQLGVTNETISLATGVVGTSSAFTVGAQAFTAGQAGRRNSPHTSGCVLL